MKRRYAVTIARPNGSYWRIVHLWAASSSDAIYRINAWCRREGLIGYTADDATEEYAR